MADAVDEAEVERLAAGPEGAGKEFRLLCLERAGAAIADQGLESLVNVELNRLEPLDIFGLFRLKGIENGFVLAGGVDTALDAELRHRLDETEARGKHADRSDD